MLYKFEGYNGNLITVQDLSLQWMKQQCGLTWLLKIVDKTGRRDIPLKSTGHQKVRVSVSLTAKADGARLKPFIVCGAMRACKRLNEELSPNVSLCHHQMRG